MTTGEAIRSIRKSKGMTQKRLGELAGIAEPTIRSYESGRLNPKIETLKKIAAALEVEVSALDPSISLPLSGNRVYFYFPEEGGSWQFDPEEKLTEPHVLRIAYEFEQLNDLGKDVAVERVKELSEIPKYKK